MIELIEKKLVAYNAANQLEEEHALKEIIQDIALYGLWRTGFFEVAAFQGGTSLRILYGMTRFSEDLDFILKAPDSAFVWSSYLRGMLTCFKEFGLKSEVLDKGKMDQRIKRALIKDNSISKQLNLSFYRDNPARKLKIKLEIDVDPPSNSNFAYSYLDFPLDFEICHQDLSSNFSLKIHALLCRPYLKGRDWYDFNWYIKQGVQPNFPHLQAALMQWGPWQGQDPGITIVWLQQMLSEKITHVDWEDAVRDVERFLSTQEQLSLKIWSSRFFLSRVEQLQETAINSNGKT
ncbi:MAG: nucleotidyl transferase AbiEii/AbiGii toxin family protein [Thermodesulfobacteriota bacterium]|nr:nucleotidyl transferase AbiEii/AbiGii toxin family protein [Thermodesulfobacteriota bacterium]